MQVGIFCANLFAGDFVTGLCGEVDCVENLHEGNAVLCGGDAGRAVDDAIDEVVDFAVEQTVKGQLCAVHFRVHAVIARHKRMHLTEAADIRLPCPDLGAAAG